MFDKCCLSKNLLKSRLLFVIGFLRKRESGNTTLLDRRDAQGNIVALIDSSGAVVVRYAYDAWGNHAVLDGNGNDITDEAHIGNLNPFRYRGYFYDTETELYYLQTRYYDPEVGRFITIDGIEYLDPENINGLNLYAYCGNNPVMRVDPTGQLFGLILGLIALAGLAVTIGGVVSGNHIVTAVGLSLIAIPAIISGGMAIATGIAGATLTGVVGGVTAIAGIGSGLFASAEIQQAITGNNWMLDAGMSQGLYYGLMLSIATVATLGTFASAIGTNLDIKSIDGFGRYGKFGKRGYLGMKFQTGAGKTHVLTFHTHSHVAGKTVSQWHWQLQKWNPQSGQVAGTIKKWLWWCLKVIKK